ncbi:MAG: DEAD/DEAH box helicase [Saprospiraceae bacterium]|nr:DEAD/DEAH box helicase [Saprospiraceae bacterium]
MTVDRQFVLEGDWFDLYGRIMIGEDSYPIKMLFENIKKNDPLFIMKDGRVFIIPEEVMARYEQLVRFSKSDHDEWKLSKQHFTLIDQSIGMPEAATHILYSDDDIVYAGSDKLKAKLRPYQIQGVKWLIKHRRNGMGACLADDMGLGKTLQTLAALLDAKENDVIHEVQNGLPVQLDLFGEQHVAGRKALCALIVLPASLIFNWREEIKKFVPSFMVLNYTGPSRKNAESTIATFDIILTTYQTAVMDIDILKAIHFNYIVLDESQQIRNKNSKIFKSLNQLQTNFKISLSGTPIENSLADLWSQMEFINPQILGSYAFFKQNYQLPIEKLRDSQAIQHLKTVVDPFILRRTKEQAAPDLPQLTEIIHYSDMAADQTKVYEKERSAARNFLLGLNQTSGEYRFHVLASLTKLRQLANHPRLAIGDYDGESGKFDDVTSQISTIVRSGHKVLVFSSFKAHLSLLAEWMKEADIPFVMLTGEVSADKRQAAVQSFQNDDSIQVFLISIKAGGTGLNLTAADYVFILDPWWNPFVEKQAVARAHRIGQKNKVIVTRFICIGSIEEKILLLQDRKKLLSDDIIDRSVLPDLNVDDLELLLS